LAVYCFSAQPIPCPSTAGEALPGAARGSRGRTFPVLLHATALPLLTIRRPYCDPSQMPSPSAKQFSEGSGESDMTPGMYLEKNGGVGQGANREGLISMNSWVSALASLACNQK